MYYDASTGTCQLLSERHCGLDGKIDCYEQNADNQTLVLSWKCDKDDNNDYTCQIDKCKEYSKENDAGNCECEYGYYLDESSDSCLPFDAQHCGYEEDESDTKDDNPKLINCIENMSIGAYDVICYRNDNKYMCLELCYDGYSHYRQDESGIHLKKCTKCQSHYHKKQDNSLKCEINDDNACGSKETDCTEIKANNPGVLSSTCVNNLNNNNLAKCNIICDIGYDKIYNSELNSEYCKRYASCNPVFIYDGNIEEDNKKYDEISLLSECLIEVYDEEINETKTIPLDECYSKTTCPNSLDCESNSEALTSETIFAALYAPGCPKGFTCNSNKDLNIEYCERPKVTNTTCSNSEPCNSVDHFCAWNGTCQQIAESSDECTDRIISESGIQGDSFQVCESQPLFCNTENVKNYFKNPNEVLDHALLDAYADDVFFSMFSSCNKYLRLRSFFKTNKSTQEICKGLNTSQQTICNSPEDLIQCHNLLYERMMKLSLDIMAGNDTYNNHTADIGTAIRLDNSLIEAYSRPEWQHIEQPSLCTESDEENHCDAEDKLYCACTDENAVGSFLYTNKNKTYTVEYICSSPEQINIQKCEAKKDCIYYDKCINGYCLDEPEYCTAEVYWKLFENKEFLKYLEEWILATETDKQCDAFRNLVTSIKKVVSDNKLSNSYCQRDYKDEYCKNGTMYMNCSKLLLEKISQIPNWDVSFTVRYLNYSTMYTDTFDDWSGDSFKCPFK